MWPDTINFNTYSYAYSQCKSGSSIQTIWQLHNYWITTGCDTWLIMLNIKLCHVCVPFKILTNFTSVSPFEFTQPRSWLECTIFPSPEQSFISTLIIGTKHIFCKILHYIWKALTASSRLCPLFTVWVFFPFISAS